MTPNTSTKRTYPALGLLGFAGFVLVLTLGIDPALKPFGASELVVIAAWQILLLLAVWLFATYDGLGFRSLNPGKIWNRRDGLAMVALELGFIVGSIAFIYPLRSFLPQELAWTDEFVRSLQALDPVAFGVVAVGLALLVGVTEELAFRSYLITRLRGCGLPAWPCILISAAVFGLIHLDYDGTLLAIQKGVFFGIPAGYFFHRRGSILPLIALHSLVDALAFVAGYLIPLPSHGS